MNHYIRTFLLFLESFNRFIYDILPRNEFTDNIEKKIWFRFSSIRMHWERFSWPRLNREHKALHIFCWWINGFIAKTGFIENENSRRFWSRNSIIHKCFFLSFFYVIFLLCAGIGFRTFLVLMKTANCHQTHSYHFTGIILVVCHSSHIMSSLQNFVQNRKSKCSSLSIHVPCSMCVRFFFFQLFGSGLLIAIMKSITKNWNWNREKEKKAASLRKFFSIFLFNVPFVNWGIVRLDE